MPEAVDAVSLHDRGVDRLSDEDFENNTRLLQILVMRYMDYEYKSDGISLFIKIRLELGNW